MSPLAIAALVVACLVGSLLLAWGLMALVTWIRSGRAGALVTVPVDWRQYALDSPWYEIARYPQRFERGCRNVTATYTLLQKSGHIRVENRCQRLNEEVSIARGTARPTSTPGLARVSFFPGAFGQYAVVKKEADLAVVTNRQRSSLWVLARQRQLAEPRRRALWSWLRNQGFDLDKIEYPVQR